MTGEQRRVDETRPYVGEGDVEASAARELFQCLHIRTLQGLRCAVGRSRAQSLRTGDGGHYGNMSAASVPCVIAEKLKSGELKTPSTLLLSAFGAGMTSAGAIIKLR